MKSNLYLLSTLASLACVVPAYAKTLVVSNNPALASISPCSTAAYTTISSAIAAAASGDAIHVCPGTYTENLSVSGFNGLTIQALNVHGSSLVNIEPNTVLTVTDLGTSSFGAPENANVNPIVYVTQSKNIVFNGVSVNGQLTTNGCGGNYVGVYYANATGTFTKGAVTFSGLNSDGSLTGCQEGHGIFVDSGSGGTANLTVSYSSIHDFDKSGIFAFGGGTTLTATHNSITGAGPTTITAQNGVEAVYGAKAIVNDNVITAVDYTPTSSSATGILFFEAAQGSQANGNTISETNGAVYFYQSAKSEANDNMISGTTNYSAMSAFQSNDTTFKGNFITGTVDVLTNYPAQPAIYICSSGDSATDNTITDALVGVQVDTTSIDGCSSSYSNTVAGNIYISVGINSQIATDSSAPAVTTTRMGAHEVGYNRVSPSK